jgi:hypothetical protein
MRFLKNLFCRKKKGHTPENNMLVSSVSVETQYYISLDNEVFGPFSLSELKNDYPIMEDTLITTDTLNGEWYEAQCFECFDELFNNRKGFRINEFGEIVRS